MNNIFRTTYTGKSKRETTLWKMIRKLIREARSKRIRFSTIIETFAELDDSRMTEIISAALGVTMSIPNHHVEEGLHYHQVANPYETRPLGEAS
jgi:nitroreductase